MDCVKFAFFRTRKLHYSCWPPGPKLLSSMGGMDTPCPWPQGLPEDHGTSSSFPALIVMFSLRILQSDFTSLTTNVGRSQCTVSSFTLLPFLSSRGIFSIRYSFFIDKSYIFYILSVLAILQFSAYFKSVLIFIDST